MSEKPITTKIVTEIQITGCSRCGECCRNPEGDLYLGGTAETDARLRGPDGSCKYLSPEVGGGFRCALADGSRPLLCAIYPAIGWLQPGCTAQPSYLITRVP